MLEISKLNHVFSVNVLQQAEQIEHLYNEVCCSSCPPLPGGALACFCSRPL